MRVTVFILCAMVVLSAPAVADFASGFAKFEQGDFQGAVRDLQPLASQGDVRSQYMMGVIVLNGWGGTPDAGAAAAWFRKAAEQGHVEAQVELARIYRDGEGLPQDLGEMVAWYARAAEQGHVGAQLLVADAYAYGQGVEPDLVQAYMWYEIAMRYWGHLAEAARDVVGAKMTQDQIAEARRLAEQKDGAAGGQSQ